MFIKQQRSDSLGSVHAKYGPFASRFWTHPKRTTLPECIKVAGLLDASCYSCRSCVRVIRCSPRIIVYLRNDGCDRFSSKNMLELRSVKSNNKMPLGWILLPIETASARNSSFFTVPHGMQTRSSQNTYGSLGLAI